jgi:hypothetical protein
MVDLNNNAFSDALSVGIKTGTSRFSGAEMAGIYNLASGERFSATLKAFEAQNIPVILLKGIVFFIRSGGRETFDRPMGDIDILVRRDDLEKAKQLLLAEGYSFVHGNMANAEVYGVFEPIEMYIDLHRSLINPKSPAQKNVFDPNEQNIWERAEAIFLNDTKALKLSKEDELIYLCFHVLKERFSDVKWISDIISLVGLDSGKFDSTLFIQTAREAGTLKLCLFVMDYIEKYYGVNDLPFTGRSLGKAYKFYDIEKAVFLRLARIKNPLLFPLKNLLWILAMDSATKKAGFIAELFTYLSKRR